MKDQIKDLIEYKQLDMSDYSYSHDLYEALDYDGALHELIDGSIDIYNYSLRQWAVDNYEYVEDAIDQGLVDTSNFDFHGAIQAGQYLQLQEQANEAIEEIFTEYQSTLETE